ncbi:PDR/VanB family oxidoreductase [Streptomyces sp. NPDC089799]|uniref:PDR/VanB family oxidoreductase n=1 Tax=Streptomyces sp. NPDC089799 TaxID=3155066 RepID=UPI003437609B
MNRALKLAALAGTAYLTRRTLRTRIRRSPLWPLPALPVPVSGRSPRRWIPARITSRTEPADGVVLLTLETPEAESWAPGAHVDVRLPSGLVRQYSLCGDPADAGRYRIAIRLVDGGRGGSAEAHAVLRTGTTLEVRPPRNQFALRPAPSYAFVAGGIGITPVLPMLAAAGAAGADWTLLYCGRSRASMPFLDELAAYGDRVTVVAEDEQGLPDLAGLPAAALVYCCGPEPLMDAVRSAAPAGTEVVLERFAPAASPTADAHPFTVELHRSGGTVGVGPGESALTAVRRALPDTPYSCGQGFCGTCRQRVLSGEVDHRDTLLSDAEREDSMLLCVSRAAGDRLVLDL